MSAMNRRIADRMLQFIMPCTEVTRLLSSPAMHPLSGRKRIALRIHLMICSWCSRYQHQLAKLREALRRYPVDAEGYEAPSLSPAARERIRKALDP